MTEDVLKYIKIEIREDNCPFFSDEEIEHYYLKNRKNLDSTIYESLILKSENTMISVSGLSTQDTSNYFMRLASKYRPNNSGHLLGG